MAYTIQSPFGRIDYYDNYGFDCIAQYHDEHGIMFGNYTQERLERDPGSRNIVAVFRITKRKPIPKKVSYIVYDTMRPPKVKKIEPGAKDLSRFPNFSKTGSVKGMRKLYYGNDALLVKMGNYIYNVSSEPSIYNNIP